MVVHDELSHNVRLLEDNQKTLNKELSRILETRRMCERLNEEPESELFRWGLGIAIRFLLKKERTTRSLVEEVSRQIETIQKLCDHKNLVLVQERYKLDYRKCAACHKVF